MTETAVSDGRARGHSCRAQTHPHALRPRTPPSRRARHLPRGGRGDARHGSDEQQRRRPSQSDRRRQIGGRLAQVADRRRQRPDRSDQPWPGRRQPAPGRAPDHLDQTRGPAPHSAEPAAGGAQPPGRPREPARASHPGAREEPGGELRAVAAQPGHGDSRGPRLQPTARAGQLHAPDLGAECPRRRLDAHRARGGRATGAVARITRASRPDADRAGFGPAQRRRRTPGGAAAPADRRARRARPGRRRSCTTSTRGSPRSRRRRPRRPRGPPRPPTRTSAGSPSTRAGWSRHPPARRPRWRR